MPILKNEEIQSFAQQVAEAISSVLDIDITIVDTDMTRIAGTGAYYKDVNTILPESYTFQKVLSSGKKCFISNPGNSETCKNCIKKDICQEKATMLIPVTVDGETVAAIGLLALTAEHANKVLNNYEKYLNYMEKMSDLLAAKIKNEIMIKQILLLAQNLSAITEAYTDGIISINSNRVVTHFNRHAEIILGIRADSILNKNYEDKVTCDSITKALETGVPLDSVHSIFKTIDRKIPVILTIQPIKYNHITQGIVCFFQELNTTRKKFESFTLANTRYTFDYIKGDSYSIQKVKDLAKTISPSDSTVLLLGESGTGKELFARAIHSSSKRSHMPFVTINCSAIPDTLLESELFGYEGGSFTGANKNGKPGKFELAHKGTLFLDEIGDMPLSLQPKILRVLQEKVIERVGGTSSIPIDVRIIAATHRNLPELIKKNLFRQDLYYRINVIPINLPPLRQREEDIIPLSRYFLKKYANLLSKDISDFEQDTIIKLINYHWPGNVRELENAIEYAVNIETGHFISPFNLPELILSSQSHVNNESKDVSHEEPVPILDSSLKIAINESERQQIINALSIYGYSTKGKKKAAEYLGIGLSTLYRKIKELNINFNPEGIS
ncbi:sigma 54-interacting transcriptional regulator [Clostridium sp. MSJ-11]|uniref:Sigma 54-interacting transcriptional regulator n=1 Tax=Clostridium mobile TaxID=2841512 RepID=A0ABS6EDX5_9CLOT|nr:sigma 54-interacting transcriptional regulator [Clostridium mobile]MBU5483398.1 sigma 54-interacting transcriptional regulator [Clostridium mobile]